MKKEVEALLREIADFWFEGCTQPEMEDPLAEIRHWRTLGADVYKLLESEKESD